MLCSKNWVELPLLFSADYSVAANDYITSLDFHSLYCLMVTVVFLYARGIFLFFSLFCKPIVLRTLCTNPAVVMIVFALCVRVLYNNTLPPPPPALLPLLLCISVCVCIYRCNCLAYDLCFRAYHLIYIYFTRMNRKLKPFK